MSLRRVLFFVLIPVAVLCTGLEVLHLTKDPINPEATSRIKPGMTEAEVVNLLAKPADRQHHPWDISVVMPLTAGAEVEWEKIWLGREWVVVVHFGPDGLVCQRGVMGNDSSSRPTFFDRVRRWLRL